MTARRWLLWRRALVAGGVLALVLGGAARGELRDPMRPPTFHAPQAPATDRPTFALSTVVMAPDRRVAVVNGERVQVGDRVGGARVVEIGPAHVRLQQDGREYTARFTRLDVKTAR